MSLFRNLFLLRKPRIFSFYFPSSCMSTAATQSNAEKISAIISMEVLFRSYPDVSAKKCLETLQEAIRNQNFPSQFVLSAITAVAMDLNDYEFAKELFSKFKDCSLEIPPLVYEKFIELHCRIAIYEFNKECPFFSISHFKPSKSKHLDSALTLFQEMKRLAMTDDFFTPTANVYTALMEAHIYLMKWEDAMSFFNQMSTVSEYTLMLLQIISPIEDAPSLANKDSIKPLDKFELMRFLKVSSHFSSSLYSAATEKFKTLLEQLDPEAVRSSWMRMTLLEDPKLSFKVWSSLTEKNPSYTYLLLQELITRNHNGLAWKVTKHIIEVNTLDANVCDLLLLVWLKVERLKTFEILEHLIDRRVLPNHLVISAMILALRDETSLEPCIKTLAVYREFKNVNYFALLADTLEHWIGKGQINTAESFLSHFPPNFDISRLKLLLASAKGKIQASRKKVL